MSKYIRLELDRALPPRYDRMIELQEELREEAKRSLPSQRVREERLWEVLGDQQVWRLLETDPAAARKLALERLVR
jgi:siroheme synthase (precorrin-2 oxidase/ferrochelatase)